MARLREIEALVCVATLGSRSAAARDEGVQPAAIGRKIDSLEVRLGARLRGRTTRRLTLAIEGAALLELCPRVPGDLDDARRSLQVSDRIVDIVAEGIDCAVRIGNLGGRFDHRGWMSCGRTDPAGGGICWNGEMRHRVPRKLCRKHAV